MKLYIKRDRPDSSTPLFDWATPDEIKLAHPKCGECRWIRNEEIGSFDGHIVQRGQCWHESNMYHRIIPTTDYCNKWEAK